MNKKEKILKYMRDLDTMVKGGDYLIFETALILWLRSDVYEVEKLDSKKIEKLSNLTNGLDEILDDYLVSRVDSIMYEEEE